MLRKLSISILALWGISSIHAMENATIPVTIETYVQQLEALPNSLEKQLYQACIDVDLNKIRELVVHPEIDVTAYFEIENWQPFSPLMVLLHFTHIKMQHLRTTNQQGDNKTLTPEGKTLMDRLMWDSSQAVKLIIQHPTFRIYACNASYDRLQFLAIYVPHLLKLLLEHPKIKFNIASRDNLQRTPLMLACAQSPESAKLLLQIKYIISTDAVLFTTWNSTTDLATRRDLLFALAERRAYMSCSVGGRSLVEDFMQRISNRFNSEDPFFCHDTLMIFYTLLALGASLRHGAQGDPFFALARTENIAQAIFPNDHNIETVNFTNYCRRRALMEDRFKGFCEAQYPEYPIVGNSCAQQFLMQLGGTPNVLNGMDRFGLTPLMWAAAGGNELLVRELLAVPGIDGSVRDAYGNTALHYACRGGLHKNSDHGDVIRLLLAHDTVPTTARNNNGIIALQLAGHNAWRFKELQEMWVALLLLGLREKNSPEDAGKFHPELPRELWARIAQFVHLDAPKPESPVEETQ